MLHARGVFTLLLTTAVVACESSSSTSPGSHARVSAAVPPRAVGDWYPTNPDGSPDFTTTASVSAEWATATITGSVPAMTGKIDAGFAMLGSRGYINIYPSAFANDSARTVTPELHPINEPAPVVAARQATWTGTITGICGFRLGGFVDFAAWNVANGVQWGSVYKRTGNIQEATGGSACSNPFIMLSPAGEIRIDEDATVSFDIGMVNSVMAGTGTVTNISWKKDGAVVSSGTTNRQWTDAFAAGTHSVSVTVTNSIGRSTTNSATVIAEKREEEVTCNGIIVDDPSSCPDDGGNGGGGEGGGGGNGGCEVWRFVLKMSDDGGETWYVVSIWYEYINC